MNEMFTYGNSQTIFGMKYWLKKKLKTESEDLKTSFPGTILSNCFEMVADSWTSYVERKRKHVMNVQELKKSFDDYQNKSKMLFSLFHDIREKWGSLFFGGLNVCCKSLDFINIRRLFQVVCSRKKTVVIEDDWLDPSEFAEFAEKVLGNGPSIISIVITFMHLLVYGGNYLLSSPSLRFFVCWNITSMKGWTHQKLSAIWG